MPIVNCVRLLCSIFSIKPIYFTASCLAIGLCASAHSATISINAVAGDNAISALEDDADIIVSGTTADVQNGNIVTVNIDGVIYNDAVLNNFWTITVEPFYSQRFADTFTVTANVADNAGASAPQATQIVTHAVPKISINPVAQDDIINASEDDASLIVTGATQNIENGQTVSLQVNGQIYTTSVANNSWSVTVPQADVAAFSVSPSLSVTSSNIAGDSTPTVLREITYDTNATFDFDGDGVGNRTDQDADNDGLVNTQEQVCFFNTALNRSGYAVNVDLTEGNEEGVISDLAQNTLDGFALNYGLSGTATWGPSGIQITSEGVLVGDALKLQPAMASSGNGFATYDLIFNNPVIIENLTFSSLDFGDRLRFDAFDASGVPIVLGATNFTVRDNVIALGNAHTFVGTRPSLAASEVSEAVSISVKHQRVKRLVVTADKNNAISGSVTVFLSDISYCLATNSDADNLPDYIDIDSDNDGLPDNIEAQNTSLYQPPSGTVNAVTGIDSAYGAGLTPLNTFVATAHDYLNRDTDGDGIGDNSEAYGTALPSTQSVAITDTDNDGLLDIFENNTPSDGPQPNDGLINPADVFVNSDSSGAYDYRVALDTDNDGILDIADIDDDNDGVRDSQECSTQVVAQTIVNGLTGQNGIGQRDNYWQVKWPSSRMQTASLNFAAGNNQVQNAFVSGELSAAYVDPRASSEWITFDFTDIPPGTPASSNRAGIHNDANGDGLISGSRPEGSDDVEVIYTLTVNIPNEVLIESAVASLVASVDNRISDVRVNGVSINETFPTSSFNRYQTLILDKAWRVGLNTVEVIVVSDPPAVAIIVDEFTLTYNQCLDTDTDGHLNHQDIDADNDGIPDNIEFQTTQGYIAPLNTDTDTDGLDNAYDTDNSGVTLTPVNTDSMDLPDYLDINSDNDSGSDQLESGITLAANNNDTDQDGLLDAYENGSINDGFIVNDGITSPSMQYPNIDDANDIDIREVNPPSIAINVVAGDDVINITESNSDITVTGSVNNIQDNQPVTVAINGETFTGSVSGNTWTVVVPTASIQSFPASTGITANASNTAGDMASQALRTVTRTLAAPVVTINIVAQDDIINRDENNSPLTITGTTTNVDDGRNVTVTFDGQLYTAPVTSGVWSVVVPVSAVQAFSEPASLTANVSTAAGDNAPVASRNITRSGPAPTVTINTIAGDDSINETEDDNPIVISGETQFVENGQTLTLTVNSQMLTAVVQNNTWSISVPASTVQAFDAQEVVAVQVENTAQDNATAERIISYSMADPSMDSDDDGIPDIIEGNDDADDDGLPNALDPDSDNDGIDDAIEAGVTGNDADNDGIDDAFDADTLGGDDQNGDGIIDNAPTPDTDSDGTPDYLDTDSDNDTVPDRLEAGVSNTPVDTDQDGLPDYRDLDSDGDRIADVIEVGENPLLPQDTDNDGIPDVLDIDSDGDNIIDTFESINIPAALNTDMNSNGIDDSIDVVFTMGTDADSNGIDDRFDTLDTDSDDIPDYLDTDADGDGINDNIENDVLVTPTALDTNANGLIDTIDVLITSGSDTNQNGIDDAFEPTDTDGDGTPDFQDTDSDNDSLLDENEGSIDTDGDGDANYRDTDSDNDTLTDTQEAGDNTAQPRDTDGDGMDDYLDVDSDNDGLLDSVEASGSTVADSDADGVPDYLDIDADNDGLLDAIEIAAVAGMDSDSDTIIDRFDADADNDGQIDTGKTDADNDGIDDAVDADVNGVTSPDINNDGIQDTANVFDSDGDGVPNVLDLDSDNDGLTDVDESGGLGRDENEDGRLDGNDLNNNGVIDAIDSTLGEPPVVAPDTDQDEIPDYLDLDSDGDGLSDLSEAGLLTRDPDADGVIGNAIFADSNGNGLSDLVEPQAGGLRPQFTDSDFDGIPDTLSLDSDGDGNTDLSETVGSLIAAQLDPDGDGKLGDQAQTPADNNRNGIADISEDINSAINVRARADTNGDGVSDVVEEYLNSIRVLTPAQPLDPLTGVVNLPDADFDRDGYPDVIEVRFGGNPLQSAEQDSNGNGIPDWVEQTDTDGDGSNDSDNDGFSDLLEQVIGTNSQVSEPQDVLFDAAQDSILNQARYDGRSNKPVIWVDTIQATRNILNVQNGQLSTADPIAVFNARIGNYRVFGDPRDATTTPVYDWSSPNTLLADIIANTSTTDATLTLDASTLPVGFYTLTLSVTLDEHTSVTDHVFEVIEGIATLDNDRDRQPNEQDSRSANIGFLHDIESSLGFYFNADSPVMIDQTAFSDQAIQLRQGQFVQVQPSLAVALSLDELTAAVNAQNPAAASVQDEAFSHDVIYDYEVINLPFVGASARIIIPLIQPIRPNATLRQYSTEQGWQPMMLDLEQEVLSAPWLPDTELFDDLVGVCPDPESNRELFTPGLTEGHQCVMLTVQDGSVNDTENNGEQTEDGQGDVNGLIKNTVSLAVAASEVRAGRIETGLNGGGSMNKYAFLALFILWLSAMYRVMPFTLNSNRK